MIDQPFFSCIIMVERGQGMSMYHHNRLKKLYDKARREASKGSIVAVEKALKKSRGEDGVVDSR